MQKILFLIFIILLSSSVFAADGTIAEIDVNVSVINATELIDDGTYDEIVPEPVQIMPVMDYEYKDMTLQCRDEWNKFIGMQPEDLVRRYCNLIDYKLIFVLALVFFMWLCEPILRKKVETTDYNYLIPLYKWIGLGLIFMVGYILVIRGVI